MPADPATSPGTDGPSAAARRTAVIVAGHRGDVDTAREGLGDPDVQVRVAALGALARAGGLAIEEFLRSAADVDPAVRRRAVEVSPSLASAADPMVDEWVAAQLRSLLADFDPLVIDHACWQLAERRTPSAVPALCVLVSNHTDPRCREAAVAALGAIGDPRGLPAVLGALEDKPVIRRRAAVALAAFDDPEADAALRRCLEDRDWQVRQVAEILLEE